MNSNIRFSTKSNRISPCLLVDWCVLLYNVFIFFNYFLLERGCHAFCSIISWVFSRRVLVTILLRVLVWRQVVLLLCSLRNRALNNKMGIDHTMLKSESQLILTKRNLPFRALKSANLVLTFIARFSCRLITKL